MFGALHESGCGPKQTWASALHMSAFGGKADVPLGCNCLRLTQSGHFDAAPTSNSITAGFRFIVAREIIHLRPTAFPSRENDYVRTIFIGYPAVYS